MSNSADKAKFDAKKFLATVPHSAGVYRMFDSTQTVIYVGKAKDLRKRLSSYFHSNLGSIKTEKLVSQIEHIEFTITRTEIEALLLEQNYIKTLQPRYNVLLRDDKSYPYILLTQEQHPRLTAYRGSKKIAGEYFGPYPHASDVRETLSLLQKLFPVRQCENSVYKNRSRPCLQYQIKRCSAPCVKGLVTDEEYNQQVNLVRLFLQGKDDQVRTYLIQKMEQASQELRFEEAGRIRDQIKAINGVIEQQYISRDTHLDMDIIAFALDQGIACVQVLFVRKGKILGNRNYFPVVPPNTDLREIGETFLGQFYVQSQYTNLERIIPQQIITNLNLENLEVLKSLLKKITGRTVQIIHQPKGEKSKFLHIAELNVASSLSNKLKQNSLISQRYEALQNLLGIANIKRMECFDLSHTLGNQTMASCVVFNEKGILKSDYRLFNISGITPGDDYAGMEQALKKRYDKPLEAEKIPDILFIDGGKGQLNRALKVFRELNVPWDKHQVHIIGIAKGVDRKAGLETIIRGDTGEEFNLPADSPALHLIQHIRDESHNYAITGHRKKRQKVFTQSGLESINGVGAKRRSALLKHFGGMQGLKNASVEEISKIPNISRKLAEVIYDTLHHG